MVTCFLRKTLWHLVFPRQLDSNLFTRDFAGSWFGLRCVLLSHEENDTQKPLECNRVFEYDALWLGFPEEDGLFSRGQL
jgi:hypothetical protein